MPKPTVVLIPGAWHTPEPYQPFLSQLEALGFATACKKIPSVISPNPAADSDESVTAHTVGNDVAYAHDHVILPELEKNDVILIVHSYGGIVGGGAAHGLSPADRKAQGKTHGVVGIIYLCAIVGFEGKPMLSSLDKLASWVALNDDKTRVVVPDPASVFYEQLPEDHPERVAALAGLQHHASSIFTSSTPPQAWTQEGFGGRLVYVRCHQDKAVPLQGQDMFHGMSNEQAKWALENIEAAGHSPFMTHRDELVSITAKWADQWA